MNKTRALPAGHSASLHHQHRAKPHRSRTPRRRGRLYVWFHGLFGFCIKKDHIVVVTPMMEEHRYFAGAWNCEQPLKAGEWYRLLGVNNPRKPNTAPKIDPAKVALLSGISKVDLDASYFLMRLDFPKQIIPVRYVPATFSGSASRQLHAPFPLVHLFEYEISCPSCLRLEPLVEWPARKQDSAIMNLHVFAEPEHIVENEHAMHAFESLIQMFPGVDLRLKDSRYTPGLPLDPNIPKGNLPLGLDPRQEQSLAERNGKSGTQPANCFALFGQT